MIMSASFRFFGIGHLDLLGFDLIVTSKKKCQGANLKLN